MTDRVLIPACLVLLAGSVASVVWAFLIVRSL